MAQHIQKLYKKAETQMEEWRERSSQMDPNKNK